MVATTRSAAARQQRSPSTNTVNSPVSVNKAHSKKKKKVAKQHIPPFTELISTEPMITTTTAACPNVIDDTTTAPPPACMLETTLYHQDHHSINNNINNGEQNLDFLSPSIHSIYNDQHDNVCVIDDNNEFDAVTSWSVDTGEIEWCKTNRGNDRLCMCGHTKGTGCRTIIYIRIDTSRYKSSNFVEHNHPPNYQNAKRLLILQKIKDRVLSEPSSVTRIIEDEYIKGNLNSEERCHFLLPQAQASKFYKIRAKLLPPTPKSLDFEVPTFYSTTHQGENFLLYDATHKKLGGRLMIFSTRYLIQMLCSCEVILVDGKFKTRPTMFSQVYVIMGQHLDEAIPLVWCLAPKRTQGVCEKIFKFLMRKSMEFGFNFEPKCAYLDFELATINALEKMKIGLSTLYDQNEEIKVWLKSFMALPLVKDTVVRAATDYLIDNPPVSHHLSNEFSDYFRKQMD
ncbi:unnamed protein product [Adineta ricciae]|uniref:MULE transposase domain-containing protein n=1 Tax=Adineta ricciae TaxID=249248 RepID=A0A815I3V4_ADIRI|nr:unnamed protein product [Adineta ricciae]